MSAYSLTGVSQNLPKIFFFFRGPTLETWKQKEFRKYVIFIKQEHKNCNFLARTRLKRFTRAHKPLAETLINHILT